MVSIPAGLHQAWGRGVPKSDAMSRAVQLGDSWATGTPIVGTETIRTTSAQLRSVKSHISLVGSDGEMGAKNANPSWSLIGCAFIYALIATAGIVLNSSVILVTLLTKSFRGTVNYLLALCSLFELLHQSGQFLFVYIAFSGRNFIENRLAAKILFIPTIGLGGITPTMFFTGIDRLIGIAFSEIHDKLKTRLYLAMITVISVSYGFLFSVVSYQGAKQDGDLMVTGSYTDALRIIPLFVTITNLFTLMTVAIYLFLGITIRIKASGLPSANSFNRRTFRALFCIITVNIGGYFITSIAYFLLAPSITCPVNTFFCALMAAIPLNIAAASNGPILYFTSTEYRQAFQKEFPFIFKQTPNQNQVAPQQNGPPIRISCDAAMDEVARFVGTFAAREQQAQFLIQFIFEHKRIAEREFGRFRVDK
ncbi:hypothetical protein niasHS_010003 [Heterodera schachtii]|uniref:G protein-coupled receptor n=1 Tax=Heterodera schachtii TaxID=97005 RepID=A0ABD2JDF8_HETSC